VNQVGLSCYYDGNMKCTVVEGLVTFVNWIIYLCCMSGVRVAISVCELVCKYAAGSVGAIRNVAHPVNVARLVMEKTSHVMLVGEGAKRFASEQGVPEVPMEKLVTEFAKASLERTQKTGVSGTTELGYVAALKHFNISLCVILK